MAGPPTLPEVEQTATNQVSLTLQAVIVYDRAGSWKRRAYWDEYVLRVVNQSPELVVIDAVTLVDFLDRVVAPGTDPWALEKAGRKHEKYLRSKGIPADAFACVYPYRRTIRNTAVGATTVTMFAAPMATGTGIMFVAVGVGTLYAPVWATNKLFIDPSHRERLAAEFNRRRLALPVGLAPGASVTGSVFFPLTPGPERLDASGRIGDRSWTASLKLPWLAGVHFTYVPDKAASKRALTTKAFWPQKVPERKE